MNRKTMMEKIINSGYKNIAGIVVRKHGDVVYEKYYNNCSSSSTIHIYSATKSITSALCGIAWDKGLIKDLDTLVLDYYEDYEPSKNNKTIKNITLRNLLTMTAPYTCKTEPFEKFFTSENWIHTALDILGGNGTIGDFRYAPIVGTHILAGILRKAINQPILEFARENLFNPLGITVANNLILQTEQEHKDFMYDKTTSGWMVDPQGNNVASMGLSLTANDMNKIGQLYLNEGMLQGKQFISKDWIHMSTSVQSQGDITFCPYKYGYLWWIIDEAERSFAAVGDGGNVIYVNPKKDMVVSILSTYMPNAKDRIRLIREYIEPAFE